MQLAINEQIETPIGTIKVTIGHNLGGLFASYRFEADEAQAQADEAERFRLMKNIKQIGYYAKLEDIEARKANEQATPALRFGTTQGYMVSWLLKPADIAVLAGLELEPLRAVMGLAVSLHRRIAPAGRAFNELSTAFVQSDNGVKNAIRDSLKRI